MASPSRTREILENQLQKLGRKYEVIMELDSLDMIKKYVALGMGISVGPKLAIEKSDLTDLRASRVLCLWVWLGCGAYSIHSKRMP